MQPVLQPIAEGNAQPLRLAHTCPGPPTVLWTHAGAAATSSEPVSGATAAADELDPELAAFQAEISAIEQANGAESDALRQATCPGLWPARPNLAP